MDQRDVHLRGAMWSGFYELRLRDTGEVQLLGEGGFGDRGSGTRPLLSMEKASALHYHLVLRDANVESEPLNVSICSSKYQFWLGFIDRL